MDKLIDHIGGSFVLASTLYNFIVQPATEDDPTTPMDRLPLTLTMNSLDSLYSQTLARSQHLPHFRDIISTIVLLEESLPIIGIADLLGIAAYKVVSVLLKLQAIIHVPRTDEEGKVTLCHTSLQNFLITESRSGAFFVRPSFHLHLSYYSFSLALENGNGPAEAYAGQHFDGHWDSFTGLIEPLDLIEIIKGHSLHVVRLPCEAFMCSMLFYSLFLLDLSIPNLGSCLLTELSKQLVLAVECPNPRARLWLETGLYYDLRSGFMDEVEFTEGLFETLQRDVRRASSAIDAMVCIVEHHPFVI
jgi:hypothetical protein